MSPTVRWTGGPRDGDKRDLDSPPSRYEVVSGKTIYVYELSGTVYQLTSQRPAR